MCVCARMCMLALIHVFMWMPSAQNWVISSFNISLFYYLFIFLRLDFPLRLMLDNLAGLASSRAPESTFPFLPSAGIAEAYTIPLHVDVRIQA